MSPTPRAAALVAAAALTALLFPPWVAGLEILCLVAATVFDAWGARPRPELDTKLPRVLARGVPARYSVTATTPSVTIRQPNVPALEFEPREASEELHGNVVPKLRGRHEVPAPSTVTAGPLGLGRWFHPASGTSEVLVYPDLPNARRIARAVREGRFGDPAGFTRGPLGLGTEFESIRDYVPDDDFRQVNWRATARVGRPMTNQYRVEQDRDVMCVVDTGRLMAAPVTPDATRLDAALDATVAVALVADELGDRCGAVAFDASIRRQLRPRRAGGRRVVAGVFDLEPTEADSDYELAFRSVGGGKRSLVLVFTDLVDLAAARSLLAATPFLARRHFLVVASASDPDLDAFAEAAPVDAVSASRRAVARQVLGTRAAVADRLRHAGATVVDVAPEHLSAACVGAYLRAKTRARL